MTHETLCPLRQKYNLPTYDTEDWHFRVCLNCPVTPLCYLETDRLPKGSKRELKLQLENYLIGCPRCQKDDKTAQDINNGIVMSKLRLDDVGDWNCISCGFTLYADRHNPNYVPKKYRKGNK